MAGALRGLDLHRRVRQLLMVGVAADDPAGAVAAVRSSQVGGVFLRGRTSAPPERVRRGVDALQSVADVPLLVAADQEGGLVRTLRGGTFARMPAASDQGAWAPAELERRAAAWGVALRSAGVTLNLAPVADTVSRADSPRNPPIGALDRDYGHDPRIVGRAVRAVVTGMQGAGVLTTLKHFPGLGRVRANTDVSRRAVDERADAADPYLVPFRDGVAAGSAAVMVSSATYPRLDPDQIAAFSPVVVTGLLRERLGFDGLVVSDDLGQAEAVAGVRPGRRAGAFVAAGGDLVLTVDDSDVGPMTDELLERAQRSRAFRARVDDAVRHVLAAKARARLLDCP